MTASTLLAGLVWVAILLGVCQLMMFFLKGSRVHLVGTVISVSIAAAAHLTSTRWLPTLADAAPPASDDGPGVPTFLDPWRTFWQMAGEWWLAVWPWLILAILLGAVVFAAWKLLRPWVAGSVRARAARRSERTAHAAASIQRLRASLARWETLRDAYGALLMDPVRSLELQALFDLQVAQSREFHSAWTAFDDLARQFQHQDPTTVPEHTLDRLERRAGESEIFWNAAQRNAERIGWTNLAAADQPRAARALSLLTTAHDTTATAGERDNAWALAAKILAHLNLAHLPDQAVAAVLEHARPALTSGAGS